ncbi:MULTISPECIES: ThiF family adenylyltransferase [unclassified Mesorhizobium]|uniref:ThiF family adenylyltransferase n=3 Tax=Mesorhizobium TaxID=68287 RepID=UPI00167C3414|nr:MULTISPECIES: ThiF family adenylyltransferase [unclassified Mesorhizobium]
MNDDLRFSRLCATASELADASFEPQRFLQQSVLLTGTADAFATENGCEMARCALLLLMRMTKSLVVALPAGLEALERELGDCARQHAWDEVPKFVRLPVDPAPYAAVLSIGGDPRPDWPWTVITSNGWTLRVTSTARPVDQACGVANPVAALAAASLGVGEVFKRLLKLRDDKGQFLDACVFSLWSYAQDDEAGPVLPQVMDVDLLVAGAGAIGNGVAHLLSRLPLRGRCLILDRQKYGPENWGTCLRLTRTASKVEKATFLSGLFTGELQATPFQGQVEDLGRVSSWRAPPVVLSGFDNVDARHAVQDLWPDLVIDGAIGKRLECQVSAHPWSSSIACLRCIFKAAAGERAEVVQERMTGLTSASLADLTRSLTEADIADAAPERREWLSARVGKPICSVLEEAAALSSAALEESFRPSVPFVATFSACMIVTEFVRYLTTGKVGVEPRFFFSLLWGPHRGEHYPEDRHRDCLCVTRAVNIERVRATRL